MTETEPPVQKHLFILIGLDTYGVIDRIFRAGKDEPKPKSNLIKLCFNLNRKEANVSYAQLPGDGYPVLVLKTPVDDRELFDAEVYARSRAFRIGRDDKGLFLALGFSPAVLGEAQ